ncbi:MAG: hypothetical protein ACTSWX_05380 [Promethearchaeota archaeon]
MNENNFHKRFKTNVNVDEEKRRFVQSIKNIIQSGDLTAHDQYSHRIIEFPYDKVKKELAIYFGEKIDHYRSLSSYIPNDFLGCLEAIEVVYDNIYIQNKRILAKKIKDLLNNSRVDLNIDFKEGKFFPKGSDLLDEKLVNDVLNCLNTRDHENILNPFNNGLKKYSKSLKDKTNLKDVIDYMYEALEAFARYKIGNNKNLSANRDQLIKKLKLNDYYKKMLEYYICYTCSFRHAERDIDPRPEIKKHEIEALIYLTGLFIRLGMKS